MSVILLHFEVGLVKIRIHNTEHRLLELLSFPVDYLDNEGIKDILQLGFVPLSLLRKCVTVVR